MRYKLGPHEFKIICFADDTAIMLKMKTIDEATKRRMDEKMNS